MINLLHYHEKINIKLPYTDKSSIKVLEKYAEVDLSVEPFLPKQPI